MVFAYGFYLAAVVGAFGIYLMMPKHQEGPRWMGGLFSLATLGGLLLFLLGMVPAGSRPTAYFYIFTLIAGASAALVITHPRPVYAALYFILVVLSATGLLVLLEAEFMAFAMVLIYAGAILVTYLFVIMLATNPKTEEEGTVSPVYDRVARHPIQAVAVGFFLLAVVSGALFSEPRSQLPRPYQAESYVHAAVLRLPKIAGRVLSDRKKTVAEALKSKGLIEKEATVASVDLKQPPALAVELSTGSKTIPLDEENLGRLATSQPLHQVLRDEIGNINRVGLNLFRSHTLGIELAGVLLLLAMVGAIVIARKHAGEASLGSTTDEPGSGAAGAGARP